MNTKRFLLVIAAFTAAIMSCNKPEPEPEPEPEPGKDPEATFSIDKTSVSFEAKGGTASVSITSNTEWMAVGLDWLTIEPSKGKGNATVTLTAAENTKTSERKGKITFSYSGKTEEIAVNQKGAENSEEPLPSSDPHSVDKTSIVSGQSVTLKFDTSVWTMAKGIKWSWKEGEKEIVKEGAEVTTPVEVDYLTITDNTPVDVPIAVSATVNGKEMNWELSLSVKPYLLYYNDWGVTPQAFRYSAPVFSVDKSTVYAATDRKGSKLYAFDTASGTKKWEFDPGADKTCCTTPTVNPVSGDIYYVTTTANDIYAVKADGTMKWKYEGLESVNKNSSPVVSKDGASVFFSDSKGNVHAVNALTGEKIWGVKLNATVQGMILNGKELFCACDAITEGAVFLNAADGSTIAAVDLYKNSNDAASLVVDPAKKIAYIPSKGSNQSAPTDPSDYSGLDLTSCLTAIDLAGHKMISCGEIATNSFWGGVVLANGDIIIADKDGYITRLESSTLRTVWKKGSWKRNSYNYGQPVMDTDGNIYLSAGHYSFDGAGHTIKINPDGEVLADWANTKDLEGPMAGTGLCNGLLYILCNDTQNKVQKPIMSKYVGKDIATFGWPCHGGNLQGTGCLQ